MQTLYPILTNCPYRVGDILQTFNSENPSVSWPGTTWQPLENRFLIGASTTYEVATEGGNTSHNHSTANHTLTVSEIPSHSHNITKQFVHYLGSGGGAAMASGTTFRSEAVGGTSSVGGGGGHNHGNTGSSSNMPPWKAVYMWRRIT